MDWLTVATLKYQRTVASHGMRLAVLFVLLGILVSGGAAAAYLSPPTVTETDHQERQQIHTGVHTKAIVTGQTALYEQGTILEDQPLYLTGAAPNLTVIVQAAVPDERPVAISQKLAIRYSATSDDEEFWTRMEVLDRQSGTVSNGTTTMSATVSILEIRERVSEIKDDVGSAGSVRVKLIHTMAYETGRYEGNLTGTAPLELSSQSYAIGNGLETKETRTTPVSRERPDPNAVYTLLIGGISLVVPELSIGLAVLGIALFLAGAYTLRLHRQSLDMGSIDRRLNRRQFSEWVSEGRLPRNAGTQQISVDSLADLVDIGIDTNRRVVYDSTRDLYGFIDDGVFYYYEETL